MSSKIALGHITSSLKPSCVCILFYNSSHYSTFFAFCRNYVVQLILDQQIPWATSRILDQLEGHYGTLSVQRYSSNVVEKCLKLAGDDQCDNIIRELISDPHFIQISQDPFGNYVVQTARRACKVKIIKLDYNKCFTLLRCSNTDTGKFLSSRGNL